MDFCCCSRMHFFLFVFWCGLNKCSLIKCILLSFNVLSCWLFFVFLFLVFSPILFCSFNFIHWVVRWHRLTNQHRTFRFLLSTAECTQSVKNTKSSKVNEYFKGESYKGTLHQWHLYCMLVHMFRIAIALSTMFTCVAFILQCRNTAYIFIYIYIDVYHIISLTFNYKFIG